SAPQTWFVSVAGGSRSPLHLLSATNDAPGKYTIVNTSIASRRQDRVQPAASEAPLTFAVLVFPGFPMMAFSSVIEPLRAANVLARRECYRWVIVGATPGTVEASNGVVIQPGFSAADAPKVDRVVVCSGGDADHVVADEAM